MGMEPGTDEGVREVLFFSLRRGNGGGRDFLPLTGTYVT